jgi:hypothetical protein
VRRTARIWALGAATRKRLPTLKAGDRVLDLGSGAGFDAFLASPKDSEDPAVTRTVSRLLSENTSRNRRFSFTT